MLKSLFLVLFFSLLMNGCSGLKTDSAGTSQSMKKSHQGMIRAEMKRSKTDAKLHAAMSMGAMAHPERPIVINTERYDNVKEGAFKSAKATPLSTLSIDVDTASYTNILRMIEDENRLPVKGAVRIEEMINYFSYNYPQPKAKAKHPFTITTELAQAPWSRKNKLMLVGLQAKKIAKEKLPSSNFVALVDVSGSMTHDLSLVKQTLKLLAKKLDKKDRLSIVNYATNIGVTLEPTSGDQYEVISKAVDSLKSYGGTDGASGISVAYEFAKKSFMPKGNNRILMFTDGDFNVGRTSASEMVEIVKKERKSGIYLSIVGFGRGNYNDSMMEKMADNGNGNYSYVHDILDAKKTFDTELVGTLYTLGKDVKFQVEFNPAVISSYRLIGYENRLLNAEDFSDDTKDAGEIGVGHSVTALYELVMVDDLNTAPKVEALKYQKTTLKGESKEYATIKMRYKQADGNRSLLMQATADARHKATDNLHFSAAVAGFGMILRDSAYKGSLNYSDMIKLAKSAKGKDDAGYRAGFIKLLEKAELLEQK